MTQDIAIDFDQLSQTVRRTELRRAVAISAVAHLALLVAFLYAPDSAIQVPRGVVAVELVSLSTPAPAAKAPVAPKAPVSPPPPAPPPRLKPKTVVLPAEPTTPKPRPKIAKVQPKPKPQPKPQPQPVVAPPPEQGLDDVLAQLRAESGENQEPEVAIAAPTSTGPAGAPTGVPISPEVAAWLKRAKIHVRRNWVLQPGFKTQFLEAEVRVDLGPAGSVRGAPKISRRSGNPWYDEGVVRAIQKSSPLPTPPEAGEWTFIFRPEDSF